MPALGSWVCGAKAHKLPCEAGEALTLSLYSSSRFQAPEHRVTAAISAPYNLDFLLLMYLNLLHPSRSSQVNTRKAYMLKPVSLSFPYSRFICLTSISSR